MADRRVSRESLGAWVLKCNPDVSDLPGLAADGGRSIKTWCVADNYRAALVEAGQPVLLWVSGSAGRRPTPGVWAVGRVTRPVERIPDPAGGERSGKLVVPVELEFLDAPVPRSVLATVPELHGLEVIRQPQMSNPSFVTKAELAALENLLVDETKTGTESGSRG